MTEIENKLVELIDLKDIKIRGLEIAIEHLKKRERKAIANLEYFYKRAEKTEDKIVIDKAIEIVKASYEQI